MKLIITIIVAMATIAMRASAAAVPVDYLPGERPSLLDQVKDWLIYGSVIASRDDGAAQPKLNSDILGNLSYLFVSLRLITHRSDITTITAQRLRHILVEC